MLQKRKMRRIEKEWFIDLVSRLCKEVNYSLPPFIMKALISARERERDERPREVLSILIENARMAKEKCIPICQDTGSIIVFLEKGEDLEMPFDIDVCVNEAVRKGYAEGYLRPSIVSSPFERKNTQDNTPAIVHISFVHGQSNLTIFAKGAGSENQGGLMMLKPSDKEKIKDIIVDYVKERAPYACPPIIVGIGCGGDMEIASLLAKKALLREGVNENLFIAELERDLLYRINRSGIGPGGLGGLTTAICVNIETYPCHIGSFPLAINIGCYATRYKKIFL